jgi:type I restriction enzyme, R subunit
MTNGTSIYFLDVDRASKRLVYGFFSKKDLENLLFARRHGTSLSATAINPSIVNRDYQFEAVRRTCEAFEQGKRRALVVMATGTGKTRTAMALTDVFLRADQAKRILFVADRDALVQQALEEGFQEHLPNEPATRLFSHDLSTSSRLYVVTLQTLNNVLDHGCSRRMGQRSSCPRKRAQTNLIKLHHPTT